RHTTTLARMTDVRPTERRGARTDRDERRSCNVFHTRPRRSAGYQRGPPSAPLIAEGAKLGQRSAVLRTVSPLFRGDDVVQSGNQYTHALDVAHLGTLPKVLVSKAVTVRIRHVGENVEVACVGAPGRDLDLGEEGSVELNG